MSVRSLDLAVEHPTLDTVSAAVHRPPRAARRVGTPPILLVPGAGGDFDSEGLRALASTLESLGCLVVRANLPYRQAGRRAPRADRSIPGYRAVLAAAQQATKRPEPWIVGGKSYGGRVASMAVADGLSAAGLLLYGYPLHAPGKPEQLRVEHWPNIEVPLLFLQGDRDPFCDIELLQASQRKLPRRATIHVVAGGDHSLRITAKASPTSSPSSEQATIAGLAGVLDGWVSSLDV